MDSTRRNFIAAAAALAAAPVVGVAQQREKSWRIGLLLGGPRPSNGLPPAPLREGLAKLGYVEGKNLTFESRWAQAKFEALPALAAEIVQSRVDLIVAGGWPAAYAVKLATSSIPIVVVGVGDAVESGLVASLSRPGGNLTGLSDVEAELSSKRLQLLKEAVPKAARMAVLWNQNDAAMTLRYRKMDAAANTLGVTVQALGVRAPDDFEAAFAAMRRERPDALFLVTDALTSLNRKLVIQFASEHRIPAMYEHGSFVEQGGLMSYGSSFDERLERIAYFVDRILKGAKPGDLPMEQPTRFYLHINLATARALGIAIPQSVLLRADKVIE